MRHFESGATRDTNEGKLDYEGFLHPSVLERYAQYMHKNRVQSDGNLRDSDNWQKGIPKDVYMKSMFRHFMDVWAAHRSSGPIQEHLCALLFNVMGYLFEDLRESNEVLEREEELVIDKNIDELYKEFAEYEKRAEKNKVHYKDAADFFPWHTRPTC